MNSYVPTTTFANDWGQLAVVRCLGYNSPGSLCVYNGFERKADSAAQQRQPRAAAASLLAALAAAAAGWLLL